MRYRFILSGVVCLLFMLLPCCAPQAEQPAEPVANEAPGTEAEVAVYSQLVWRHIGPPGNRTTSVVSIPGDTKVYYAGAATGGVWKSTDQGINWQPIFDDQPAQSIGALALAPSNPNIVWVGTGESWVRSGVDIGNGVYKSTDGGKTWKHMGLDNTGRISRILIHPKEPNIVYIAAMGHCYGPQQERGVFRTKDGGLTWERVLFVDEDTGVSDMDMDPKNPNVLFAGAWPFVIRTWAWTSGGPGGGLYMSRDSGTTWTRLKGHGLPESEVGKVAVAIAPNNPKRIYALMETSKDAEDGGLWRSDDGGTNWTLISRDHLLNERPTYYTNVAVAPDNQDEVYFQGVRQTMSKDGGKTIVAQVPAPGGDNHDMWIDPTDANRMVVGNDSGVHISVNRGQSWQRINLPIAQMYHVSVDNQIPYNVYGNRQDGPSNRIPSYYPGTSMIHAVGGSESGWSVPDPVDTNIIWSGGLDGLLSRFDLRTRQARAVDVWPEVTVGSSASGSESMPVKYRLHWTFPIAISPFDHNTVYVGSQYVHMTTNGGQSWTLISPDLTTNDKTKQQDNGGLTVDNHQYNWYCLVFVIAESTLEKGLIWAGTNDGLLQVTRDGGKNWTNVTKNIPNLPPWGTVTSVVPSKYDRGSCYLTVDLHQVNNSDPFVYKTTDYGKTWKLIIGGVPKDMFSYARWVQEDPVRKGMLYLGTENAIYVSFNDGESWLPLQNNLPHAPVSHIVVQENFKDLVISTYGRGFWVLDDITPLQQLTPEVLNSNVHLFPPRPAYRFQGIARNMNAPNDQSGGQSPPSGASINFYLQSAPKGEITITILDKDGKTVRTLNGTGVSREIFTLLKDLNGQRDDLFWFLSVMDRPISRSALDAKVKPGINRVWWDLRYEPQTIPLLRTIPGPHDHTVFSSNGIRPFKSDHFTSPGLNGPFVPPGVYTIKLSVDGQELTQKLTVNKDPSSGGSEADMQAQNKLSLEVRDNINTVVNMINQIEWIRKQIVDLTKSLAEGDRKAASELDNKFRAVEQNLHPVDYLTGARYDSFRTPHMLYERFCGLLGKTSRSDFRPTDQEVELHGVLKGRLADYQKQLNELLQKDLPAFNNTLTGKKLAVISTKAP